MLNPNTASFLKLKSKLIHSILILVLTMFSVKTFAVDLSSLNVIEDNEVSGIKSLILTEKKNIYKKLACPMASKSLSTVLAKAKTLKELFKNNDCMSDSNGVNQIVDNLNTISEAGNEVDASQISSVFDNINNIFENSGCALEQKGFLNYTADLIQSFSQMSLLIPSTNAIGITAASLATSSILRLISSWFKADFDFEDSTADRENFIKLNCSFFDLRRTIDTTGIKDIYTPKHEKLLSLISEMNTLLKNKKETLLKNKKNLLNNIKIKEAKFIKLQIGDSIKFLDYFKNFKENISNSNSKLQQIAFLDRSILIFESTYSEYSSFELNFQVILAGDLKSRIKKIKDTSNLLAMNNDDYQNQIRRPLIDHIDIILLDIERYRKKLSKSFSSQMNDDMTYTKLTKMILDISSKEELKISKLQKELNPIENRLKEIRSKDHNFSAIDESTGQEVNLQNITDQISEQIYGKWGDKFLEVMIGIAVEENNNFEDLYENFSNTHMSMDQKSSYESKKIDLDKEIGIIELKACQDAAPARDAWKKSKNLVEYAYDFIITNQTLFYKTSDSHKKNVQKHLKSAKIAKMILNNESVSKENKKFINKSGWKKKYLGAVMLKIEENKQYSIIIQNLYEENNCKLLESSQ